MASVSVPRVSDESLLNFFIDKTLVKYEELGLSENSMCTISLGGFSFNIDVRGSCSKKDILDDIYANKQIASSITSISISDRTFNSSRVTYERSKDSFIDQLTVTTDNTSRIAELPSRIFRHLNTLLLKGAEPCFGGSSNTLEVASAHHEVLTRLEGLSAELIEKQVKQVQDLERDKQKFLDDRGIDFAKKVNEQDEAFSKKVAELERQYKLRNNQLDEWQKKIDDADNTTTRRQTTVTAIKDVAERAQEFTFSTSVNSKMVLIVALCLLLSALGLASTWQSLEAITSISSSSVNDLKSANTEVVVDSGYRWFNYIRVFLSSALVVSSLIYLIRFFSSWMNKIANQELDNQKYVRDLNRAHVAIEMCLEWNDKKDGAIPDRLLGAVTEGLFVDKAQPNIDINHPAEQLASALIRTSDKLEFPLGSGTVTTSGKKLNKAKTDTQKYKPESETIPG
ncbi:hypothetical protein [Vibrio campbellii]|uniref:hypothetical protein n=1 Tax=Vibrio campbellii TaxID=680 RepID=UPI00168CC36C|nr:hypothetical protein [Vibrio campbellii]